jgi:hypothetical protein
MRNIDGTKRWNQSTSSADHSTAINFGESEKGALVRPTSAVVFE